MQVISELFDTTGLFYTVTMNERGWKEGKGKRSRLSLIQRINPYEKNRLIADRSRSYEDMFHFKKLRKGIDSSLSIDSYETLFPFISQLPIGQCMTSAMPINEYFTCRLIPGNFAWISVNTRGHYRYFSKRRDGETTSFDLLDLIEITYGLSAIEAVEKSVELLGIRFMEEEWKREQKAKYLRNYQLLANRFGDRSPALSSYLEPCGMVLEAMNALGTLHIHKKEYSYKGQNVFFVSSSYLAGLLGTYTASKAAKLVNLCAVLGLVEKVPTDQLHPAFLKEAAKIADMRNLGNIVSYYIVPAYQEAIQTAESRAAALKTSGIYYSNCSKTMVTSVFGQDIADLVYVQTVQKNKRNETRKLERVQSELEGNFLQTLSQYGYATKSMVLAYAVSDLSDMQRKHHLNQMWTLLIQKHHCVYQKPNRSMKMELGLPNMEYVAIPKGRKYV